MNETKCTKTVIVQYSGSRRIFWSASGAGWKIPAGTAESQKTLRLAALTEESPIADQLREKYAREGMDEDIIKDTISNTGLVLRVRNEYYPVRSCAIKSILDRAGINGAGLRRVERNVYARILNECLKVAQGDALLRISEGKVSAVLGGDGSDYAVIDTEQLLPSYHRLSERQLPRRQLPWRLL